MTWRTGNKLGRTIYRDDKLVGMLDDADLARAVVDVLNEAIKWRAWFTEMGIEWPPRHPQDNISATDAVLVQAVDRLLKASK